MENKRGQGLSTNAIIMIILGVVILVILIIGFYAGWGTLAPWLSSENVDTILGSCKTACSTQSVFSYCAKPNELNTGEEEIETTCYLLEKLDEFNAFGLEPCNIDCQVNCADVSVIIEGEERKGVLSITACTANQTDVSNIVADADGAANYCCFAKA
jgi:hypothetical protein